MTTKQMILDTATETKARADVAQEQASRLAAIFGGSDALVVNAQKLADELYAQSYEWARLATMHPKTRSVKLRELAA